MTLARELTQAQQFTDAKQAIQAIEAPIFEQLEAGLSVSALEEEVRIVGWVRPDWRKVADYF